MFEIIVIFISFICYSNSLPQNIAKNEINYNLINDISSIAGGEIAKPGQAPWQVYQYPLIDPIDSCGGSIIHKRAVLTAAHCCEGFTAYEYMVAYGGQDRTKLKHVSNVSHIILHPHWNNRTLNADICVLVLADEVQFSDDVKLIEIADTTPAAGSHADVTGWGMDANIKKPIHLKHDVGSIISLKDCQIAYKNLNITNEMLCSHNDNSEDGSGDSGGPLVVNNKLVGVVSFGAHKHPDVYADAAVFKKWAWEQVKKYSG